MELAAVRGPDATRWTIGVIDGPNLSNLGARDPGRYGKVSSIGELQTFVREFAEGLGVELVQIASNYEGEILEFIHANAPTVDGWVINPAGLTLYGESTRTALADSSKPFVETHFANARRQFPRDSDRNTLGHKFTEIALGLVMGFRQYSYCGALVALVMALDDRDFLGAP